MVPTESFRDLEIFQSAVREGSFSGAARSLGMTQPAVSLAIARLERQLGTTLFDRQSSGKRQGFVTRTGEVLTAHTSRAIAEMDEATDAITAMEGRRPVRIGLPPIITHHYFPGGLDSLANACGTHPVEILSYGSERMHTELERHGIDVGMIASVEVSLGLPRVRGWKVGSFPFLVALPKASRLADRGSVGIDELEALGLPILSFTGDFVQREALALLLGHDGHELGVAAETDQPEMMRRLVVAGMGVGVATSIAFEKTQKDLCLLPLVGKRPLSFNVFVFDDVARSVRPEAELVCSIKRVLFQAVRARREV